MSAMASLITSITSVYSTVHSGADQRKHQSSASLAFVRGIHRRPVNSPHKWPVTRKMFLFDNVIMSRHIDERVTSLWFCFDVTSLMTWWCKGVFSMTLLSRTMIDNIVDITWKAFFKSLNYRYVSLYEMGQSYDTSNHIGAILAWNQVHNSSEIRAYCCCLPLSDWPILCRINYLSFRQPMMIWVNKSHGITKMPLMKQLTPNKWKENRVHFIGCTASGYFGWWPVNSLLAK